MICNQFCQTFVFSQPPQRALTAPKLPEPFDRPLNSLTGPQEAVSPRLVSPGLDVSLVSSYSITQGNPALWKSEAASEQL